MQKGKAYRNLGTVYDSLGNYKKQSNFISSLLVLQKRQEKKVQKIQHIPTLALRITLSVFIKKQSNFNSSLLVSQKGQETKVQNRQHIPTLALCMTHSVIIKRNRISSAVSQYRKKDRRKRFRRYSIYQPWHCVSFSRCL